MYMCAWVCGKFHFLQCEAFLDFSRCTTGCNNKIHTPPSSTSSSCLHVTISGCGQVRVNCAWQNMLEINDSVRHCCAIYKTGMRERDTGWMKLLPNVTKFWCSYPKCARGKPSPYSELKIPSPFGCHAKHTLHRSNHIKIMLCIPFVIFCVHEFNEIISTNNRRLPTMKLSNSKWNRFHDPFKQIIIAWKNRSCIQAKKKKEKKNTQYWLERKKKAIIDSASFQW